MAVTKVLQRAAMMAVRKVKKMAALWAQRMAERLVDSRAMKWAAQRAGLKARLLVVYLEMWWAAWMVVRMGQQKADGLERHLAE